MTMQHPNILYVGDREKGQALQAEVAARDWYVYVPEDTMEALGIAVTFFPDIAVLNKAERPVMVAEVYHHLRTMSGDPMPLLLLVSPDERAQWTSSAAHVYALPCTLCREDLVDAIFEIVQGMPVRL